MSIKHHRRCFFKMGCRAIWQGILVLLAAAHVHSSRNCKLPKEFWGSWFHSGVTGAVEVNETSISFKGTCVSNRGARFLFQDRKHDCRRCVVIHRMHYNVLQYKETWCESVSDEIPYVCSLLTGDAKLHSMFRLDANPIPCPFPHSYTFTYSRGHAECNYPLSTVDRCTDDNRMLFKFQACPDIQGTESTTEELECLGTWKEGSNRYLIGKSDHFLATSDEDRYRCFVYKLWSDHTGSGVRMAQSGDATCNGLFSVTGGSITLKLKKVDTGHSQCRFPIFVSESWLRSLNGSVMLRVARGAGHTNSTLKMVESPQGGEPQETVIHNCLEVFEEGPHSATFITRVIRGCTSDYQCLHLIERDKGVVDVLMGSLSVVAQTACTPQYFDPASPNFTTFVSVNVENSECPVEGRYQLTDSNRQSYSEGGELRGETLSSRGHGGGGSGGGGAGGGMLEDQRHTRDPQCSNAHITTLDIGCSSTDTLVIGNTCSDTEAEYSCNGGWKDGGRQYVVVTPKSRSSKGVRRLCLMLEAGSEGEAAIRSLSSSTLSCGRNLTQGFLGHTPLNVSIEYKGGCGTNQPYSGGSRLLPSLLSHSLLLLLVLFLTSTSTSSLLPIWN